MKYVNLLVLLMCFVCINNKTLGQNRNTNSNLPTVEVQSKKDSCIVVQDSLLRRENKITNESITQNDSISNKTVEKQTKETAIVSAPIALFSDINCWYLSPDGEWITDNHPDYKFETVGKFEMRNFKYRDKNYILITRFEKYAGTTFYLIEKEEYLNTLNKLGESSIVRFPVVAYAGIGNTLRDMIELSENIIDAPKKEDAIIYKTNYMVLQYKLSSTDNLSRFFIYYQECSKYGSETSRENCSSKVSNNIEYADEDILGSDVLFNKAYYESTYKNFIDFFQKPMPSDIIPKSNKTEENADSEMEPRQ